MARGARIVNDFRRNQDVDEMYVSNNGLIKQVGEAYVSYGGVIKQWWPPVGLTNDSLAYDGVDRTSHAFNEPAVFRYNQAVGTVSISQTSGTTTYEIDFEAINPPPRAMGQYLFKLEQLSGVALTSDFTLGAWIDPFSLGTLGEFYAGLETTGTAQARFSVSANDGAGNPTGTPIEGLIDFIRDEAIGNITMSTEPWDLHNTEINELAEVFVVTVPDGWYDEVLDVNVEEAYITGEFGFPKGLQLAEIYVNQWSNAIQVKVDVISGTLAAGSDTTGSFLSTSVRRRWWIEANPGEDVTAEIDVTIQDSLNFDSVTKRVTMRATSTEESADSGVSDDFTRRDSHLDWQTVADPPFNQGTIDFIMNVDGTLTTWHEHGGEPASYPQDWNDAAPTVTDPENFESRITWLDGWRYMTYRNDDDTAWEDVAQAGASGFDSSPWQNLATHNRYRYFWRDDRTGVLVDKPGTYQIEVREVGRPETVKTKIVDVRLLIQT